MKLYAFLQRQPGVTKVRTMFQGLALVTTSTPGQPISQPPSLGEPAITEYQEKKLALLQKRLEQEQKLGRDRLEQEREVERERLLAERERLLVEQEGLAIQRKADSDARMLELESTRDMHTERISMKAKKIESDERIARLQIESKERIFDKLSEQTERHHRERIAYEREENNKNRNLMTYNVHIDNWTKKCMVQCFGTLSRWGMSSEHIVQAAEFNRNRRVTDGDMEKFVEAIAAGSMPMRLVDGSTKIVMDNNILPILHDIAERKDVKLSAAEEIKLGEALETSLSDIIDRLVDRVQDAGTDPDDADALTDSAPSDNDGEAGAAADAEEDNDGLVDPEEENSADPKEEDAHAAADPAQEPAPEIDEYEDINPTSSKYVKSLFNKITDGNRSDGDVRRSVLTCAFANAESLDSVLRGDSAVMARLGKWRQHCSSELATRSSIRSRTEVMRDDKNLAQDRRKTMIKDITRLMKKANEFDAEQGTFKCFICHKPMHINDYDVERLHVVSRADGGDCSTENLVPGCLKCNRSSGRVNPIDLRSA